MEALAVWSAGGGATDAGLRGRIARRACRPRRGPARGRLQHGTRCSRAAGRGRHGFLGEAAARPGRAATSCAGCHGSARNPARRNRRRSRAPAPAPPPAPAAPPPSPRAPQAPPPGAGAGARGPADLALPPPPAALTPSGVAALTSPVQSRVYGFLNVQLERAWARGGATPYDLALSRRRRRLTHRVRRRGSGGGTTPARSGSSRARSPDSSRAA